MSEASYLEVIIEKIPRLLGLLNRNISSRYYGCFDRDYWHYNIVDFACARKQEAVLTLTLTYIIKHQKNIYYLNEEILQFIKAALMFWTKTQNRNGSFNEWYPNENSFVATAFSTYAISESVLLLKDVLHESERQSVIKSLIKAGEWLQRRDELRVMNQQTGAAVALLNLYLLTSDKKFLDISKDKINILKQKQSSEGWFMEYEGPDIGYLSLSIDYLVKYYLKSKDKQVKEIVICAMSFIKYFIQPNLKAGGEYTSRNTEYLIPSGFEAFSAFNDDARFIASVNRETINDNALFPNIFDDRYLTYTGYTWLQSHLSSNSGLDNSAKMIINEHFGKPFTEYFKESGLLIINDNLKHLIINLKKGGGFRLFDKRSEMLYSDSGILVKSDDRWYTSGWLSKSQYEKRHDALTVSGKMTRIPDKVLSPLNNILFRLFQFTFGRSSFLSMHLKEKLRDLLITKSSSSDIRFNRTVFFSFSPDKLLEVKEDIYTDKSCISAVVRGARDTHIYVPSSRYYAVMSEKPFHKYFSSPIERYRTNWYIISGEGCTFEEEVNGSF